MAPKTDVIEQLRERVRELEEENARLNGVIESNIDDGINKIMAMSDEQVSALAGFGGSNPEDKATIARQCMDIAMLRVDLAASQEYAEQLREALEQITKQMFTSYKAKNGRDCYIEDDSGELCYIVPHEPIITAQAALSTPRDTNALDAYVAEKVLHIQEEHADLCRMNAEATSLAKELTRQRDLAVEALEDVRKELQQSNDRLNEEREIWDRVMGDAADKFAHLEREIDDCLYVLDALWDKQCDKIVTQKWAEILIRNKRGIGASSAEDSSEQTTA